MAFLHVVMILHVPRPSQKNEVCQCQEKNTKDFDFPHPTLYFFPLLKRFFHLFYLVLNLKAYFEELFHVSSQAFNLKPNVLISNSNLNQFFFHQNFWMHKK
jgi:hypothetical protein